ncbi:MAG: hypothetical protein ACKVRP_09380 [Bacteroidota bacterium]
MPTKNNFQDDENTNRVRKELQNLPKRKASWHFESQLQQRIHAERRESIFTALFARPLPAYALTIFLLAGGGVLFYNLAFDSSPLQESIDDSQVHTAEVHAETQTNQLVGPPEPMTTTSDSEVDVRTTVPEPVDGRVREFGLPVTSVGGRPASGKPALTLHDSVLSRQSVQDSLDSLGSRGDSVRPPER